MKNIVIIYLLVICIFSSCRRKNTYPDYEYLIGKYKLAYIKKHDASWTSDSIVRISPSDKYEIDFRKWSKVRLIKNGNCEKTSKVYSCIFEDGANSTGNFRYYYVNIDKASYDIFYSNNFVPVANSDTLLIQSFYPFDLASSSDGNSYWCFYAKE